MKTILIVSIIIVAINSSQGSIFTKMPQYLNDCNAKLNTNVGQTYCKRTQQEFCVLVILHIGELIEELLAHQNNQNVCILECILKEAGLMMDTGVSLEGIDQVIDNLQHGNDVARTFLINRCLNFKQIPKCIEEANKAEGVGPWDTTCFKTKALLTCMMTAITCL